MILILGLIGLIFYYLVLEWQDKKSTLKIRREMEIVIVSLYSFFLLGGLMSSRVVPHKGGIFMPIMAILSILGTILFWNPFYSIFETGWIFLMALPFLVVLMFPIFLYCVLRLQNRNFKRRSWIIWNMVFLGLLTPCTIFSIQILLGLDTFITPYSRSIPKTRKKKTMKR